MRHLKAGNRLGVTTSHRRAMMRNMVTSILEHGQITCTLARAKEVRKPLEKMISWGKKGDLNSRRQALRFVKSKEAMSQLFDNLAERYRDRQGGYSRIIKLGKNRLGDNSEMAIIQLLGCDSDQLSSLKLQSAKNKQPKKKDSTVLKEVSQNVQSETKALKKTATEINQVKAEKYKEMSVEKVKVKDLNTDSKAAPSGNIILKKKESAEVMPEIMKPESEVAPEEANVATKAGSATVRNDSEPVSEEIITEQSDSVKKTE